MQGIFHAWQVLCHWIISPAIFQFVIHTQHSPLPVPGVSDSYHPILGTALDGRQEQSSKLHSLPNSRPSYFLKSRKSVQVILRMISGLLICFWKHSSNRQTTSPAAFPRFTWVLTSPAFLACGWGQWSAAAHSDRVRWMATDKLSFQILASLTHLSCTTRRTSWELKYQLAHCVYILFSLERK